MIDNEIRNNISYVPADVSFGQECKNDFSWIDDKITFSNNAWSEIPTHTGSPSDVVITDNFIKTTGWQDLSEVIEKANFKLTSGSTAINSGADLGTFFNIDCFDNPRPQGAGWDIGAHELDLNTGNLNVGSRNGGVQLSIYPNPSTNNLISVTYKLPASCDVEIFILDISGKTVQAFKYKKQAGTNVLNFATNNFPKGIYFCKLVTGGNMVVEKFIVQN